MIDAKPDESDLPPIELAAALVRGEPTWHNLCQAAALIRDASAQVAQLTLELAAANSEVDRLRSLLGEATREIVRLAPNMTLVGLDESRRQKAIDLALRITMSPHEWTWTQEEQFDMAAYVLWAHQRLSGIKQLVDADLQQCGD